MQLVAYSGVDIYQYGNPQQHLYANFEHNKRNSRSNPTCPTLDFTFLDRDNSTYPKPNENFWPKSTTTFVKFNHLVVNSIFQDNLPENIITLIASFDENNYYTVEEGLGPALTDSRNKEPFLVEYEKIFTPMLNLNVEKKMPIKVCDYGGLVKIVIPRANNTQQMSQQMYAQPIRI